MKYNDISPITTHMKHYYFLDSELSAGYSSIELTVNDVPKNGRCFATPNGTSGNEIYALETYVTVDCIGWEDVDTPLSYGFELSDGLSIVTIRREEASPNATFIVGIGTFEITAIIYDSLGAKATYSVTITSTLSSESPTELIDITNNFINNSFNSAADNVDTDALSVSTLAVVSMLDFIPGMSGDVNAGDVNSEFRHIREFMLDSVESVFETENVTKNEISLIQQTRLISCIVRTPQQVNEYSGLSSIENLARILDKADQFNGEILLNNLALSGIVIESDESSASATLITTNAPKNSSEPTSILATTASVFYGVTLAETIANPLLDSVGNIVESLNSYNEYDESTIETASAMIDFTLVDMLKNTLPGELGYQYTSSQTGIVVDAKRSYVQRNSALVTSSNRSQTMCGSDYLG